VSKAWRSRLHEMQDENQMTVSKSDEFHSGIRLDKQGIFSAISR